MRNSFALRWAEKHCHEQAQFLLLCVVFVCTLSNVLFIVVANTVAVAQISIINATMAFIISKNHQLQATASIHFNSIVCLNMDLRALDYVLPANRRMF